MIEYIEKKKIDWQCVRKLLNVSSELNHFTNFGPVSIILENKIHDYLNLPSDRGVIVCTSGTTALHCLAEMHNYCSDKDLRWVTSNFTFPCAKQGPLRNAKVIDCNSRGNIPIESLVNLDFDGLVLTDLFGMTDREPYRQYCKKYSKILIIDSAMGFDKPRVDDDEIISFHHTKPWGFGEGGCAIIPRKHEQLLRSIINFGLVTDGISHYSTNGKMSDIASAFIIQRLKQMPTIKKLMQIEYRRISKIAKTLGLQPYAECPAWTPPCVPLLSPTPTTNIANPFLVIKKYYKPLNDDINAKKIYDNILVVPCHPNVKECSNEEIEESLQMAIT